VTARLTGWGRTAPSYGDVVTPRHEHDVEELFAAGQQLVARGLGRSYGDAAQVAGGTVVETHELGGVGAINEAGVVRVGAGVSLDELLHTSLPQGWFLPVTPGTRQVSVGGALGADVHGKNHHVDGSFGRFVHSLRLVTPVGTTEVSPTLNPELFWATLGAMGLTGVVVAATLQLRRVTSPHVLVDTDRFHDLGELMDVMEAGDDDYQYSVAWVDCMARGKRLGRSILTRANHVRAVEPMEELRRARVRVPVDAPRGLLNSLSLSAFNELWFRRAPRHERERPVSLGAFFHPLDGVGDWNRLYGPRGFLQYQFCVPDDARDTVREVIDRLSDARLASFLAVLKRFGDASPGPLSFPLKGWTLALDLPLGPAHLSRTLDEIDAVVADAGGRVYLAKDARLAPSALRRMYPRVDEFLALKLSVDPKHQLVSDLARRLDLVGT